MLTLRNRLLDMKQESDSYGMMGVFVDQHSAVG